MNDTEAGKVLASMIQFIKSHGDERVQTIQKQADDEFTIEKEKYIAQEKERLMQDYKSKLQQDEIRLRIQKSAEQNAQRISKMKTVNQLIEKLYKESKGKIVGKLAQDKGQYKTLMKDLIVQGLIKLMEPEVYIRCKKEDEQIVLSVINEANNEYKALMKKEVKFFKDKDIPCKLELDNSKYLPLYNEQEGHESCMGGLLLHAKKGRIVCSNTLDERLSLVYQEAIPDIRRILFPSFKKKVI